MAEPIGQLRAVRALEPLVHPGPDGLTEREVAVLRLVAAGLGNQEIGAHLHISPNIGIGHSRSILLKTGTPNRTRAAMYAADHQLL